MGRFENDVVLVTGGTRGIGRACAALFAQEGAKVAICGRDADTAASVAQELGGNVAGFGCDVSDSEAVDALINSVTDALGSITVLVNNAGVTRDGLLMRMKNADWDATLQTNLNSVFYACRAAARGMLKQRYGRIINMSSIVGIRGQGGQSNYAAAKAGIIGFSKSYAQEIASRNITVNVVAPGFIETDMTRGLAEAHTKGLLELIPQKRIGSPEEVAHAVAFLASREAGYITGTVLSVDGGLGM